MSFEEGVIRAIVREEVEAGLSRRSSRKPIIIVKTMTVADTEYEIPLPARTRKFSMHMRETTNPFRLAFERGRVADPKDPYITVHAKESYWEDNMDLDAIFKMYVACATAGKTLEVVAWS